jgi:hypothetical protein
MMLTEPDPPILVRQTLLMAVRDGYYLITLRPGRFEFSYDMVGRWAGGDEELIGPSAVAAQEFPAVLSGYCGPGHRAWSRLTRWARLRWGGSEAGAFQFPVGRAAAVVEYRVQWAGRVVAELVIGVTATDALAVAAHRALWESLPRLPEDEAEA